MFYEGCTLEEIKAYRDLDGEPFDFGEGLIYPSNTLGSEDAYYEMDLQAYEEEAYEQKYQEYIRASNCMSGRWYEDCHRCYSDKCVFAGKQKGRPNKYLRNRHHRIRQLQKIDVVYQPNEWRYKKYFAGYSRSHSNLFANYNDNNVMYVYECYKAPRIKWLKAYANRCVRHTMTQYGKGRTHCKEFDLWWSYD